MLAHNISVHFYVALVHDMNNPMNSHPNQVHLKNRNDALANQFDLYRFQSSNEQKYKRRKKNDNNNICLHIKSDDVIFTYSGDTSTRKY